MISILVKNKGVRKVGRLTEMTQHLVNGWKVGRVGGLFCHMKEVSNMTVKERYFKFLEWSYNNNLKIKERTYHDNKRFIWGFIN